MNELYSILRPLEGEEPPRDFKRVQVDKHGNPVVRQLIGSLLGDRVWYVKTKTPCELQRREVRLVDTSRRDEVMPGYVLEVQIPEKGHDQAVGALVRDGDAAVRIDDAYREAIEKWFREDVAARPGLRALERIAGARGVLEGKTAANAGRQLGIELKAHLDYDEAAFVVAAGPASEEASPVLKDLRIQVPSFRIVLADKLSREVQLAVDVVLQRKGVVSGREPGDEAAWRDEIRRVLIQEAPSEITAHAYFAAPDDLTTLVTGCLNRNFRRFGRSVRQIDLRRGSQLQTPVARTINLNLDWTGRPSGYPVLFQVSANMEVSAAGAYLDVGEPDLQTWLRDKAKAALDADLVDADFVNLTPHYVSKLKQRLSKQLERAAARDGMGISVFVAQPQVPPIVATRSLAFQVESTPYATRDGSFQVELEINVRGRFDELRHVTHLIQDGNGSNSPAGELPNKLKEAAREAAARVMRSTQPERYVLRFDRFTDIDGRADDSASPAAPQPNYLVDRIREEIEADLARFYQFHCDPQDIQLIQKDKKIEQSTRSIMRLQTLHITLEVEPRDRHGPLHRRPVTADYQVQAAVPQKILVVLRHDYAEGQLKNEVARQLAFWTKAFLEACPYDLLSARDYDARRKLQDALQTAVNRDAAEAFGIVFRLSTLDIDASLADGIANDRANVGLLIDRADHKDLLQQIEDPQYRDQWRKQLARPAPNPGPSTSAEPPPTGPSLPAPPASSGGNEDDTGQPRPDGGVL